MKPFVAVPLLATVLLCNASGPPRAQAQPVITLQPTSRAVTLGGSATFQVTASASTPLTFQWQFNGDDVAGAVSNRLTLTNLTLSELGVYRLIVRDASKRVTSQTAALKLARWSRLVVFGASECLAPYSNGNSWVEWLGELLGLSAPDQIQNCAVGGARSVNVRAQITQYLSANTPGIHTLLAPSWAGLTWDLMDHRPVDAAVGSYATNLSLLAQAGGRVFLLPDVMPLHLAPMLSGDAYLRSIDYPNLNARLDQEVEILRTRFGLTVLRFNLHDLTLAVWANPTAYGFSNLTSAANACVTCDPNQYYFWDGIHFTTATHRFISQAMYRAMTPPLVLTLPTRGDRGVQALQWQGGSPPFRVQRCADPATGVWQSGELSFATNAATATSAPRQYFRVMQLGQ